MNYAELMEETHKFQTLLLYLSTPALELMLQGDETRRELITIEIEARK